MARVTVEDCLDHVANRFELVMVAGKRARQLAYGKKALVRERPYGGDRPDKPTVIALREIAEGAVTPELLTREAEAEAELQEAMEMGGENF